MAIQPNFRLTIRCCQCRQSFSCRPPSDCLAPPSLCPSCQGKPTKAPQKPKPTLNWLKKLNHYQKGAKSMTNPQTLIKESKDTRHNLELILDQISLGQDHQSSKATIAVWGLMNAGKSYLLNMLTNHIDHEFFKTADVREAAELKRLELDDRIYLDTPGLDANEQDDLTALQGADKADVILFVHQLQGELEQKEIDFLTDVRTSFGEYANQNIIMVISKIDKETPEKVNEIQNKVLEQCQDILGFTPACFQISNTRYRKGVQKHKDVMVKASHIDELKEHLSCVLDNTAQVRTQRLAHKIDEHIQALKDISQQLQHEQEQLFAPYCEAFNHVHKLITKDIFKDIKRLEDKYHRI